MCKQCGLRDGLRCQMIKVSIGDCSKGRLYHELCSTGLKDEATFERPEQTARHVQGSEGIAGVQRFEILPHCTGSSQ